MYDQDQKNSIYKLRIQAVFIEVNNMGCRRLGTKVDNNRSDNYREISCAVRTGRPGSASTAS